MIYDVTVELNFQINFDEENGRMTMEKTVHVLLGVPPEIQRHCYTPLRLGYTGRGYQLLTLGCIAGAASGILGADAEKCIPKEMAHEQASDHLRQLVLNTPPANILFAADEE